MKTIAVIHGPNLNLLGSREPDTYGRRTLAEINAAIEKAAQARGAQCTFFQSNVEGELVSALQNAAGAGGVILNAANRL